MRNHTKVYMDYFGYDVSDFIPCELCGAKCIDVHHIFARGMGGDVVGDKDKIENLMGLCRRDHEMFGDKTDYRQFLIRRHEQFMIDRKPMFQT
jgi:predicted restriction endonuclease